MMRTTFVFSTVLLAASCGGDRTLVLLGGGPGEQGDCDPPFFLSVTGECIADGTCAEDGDCPEEGEHCSPTGVCTRGDVPTDCEADEDCREGMFCASTGLCADEGDCFADEDCHVDGEVCTPRNVCLPEGTCEQNGDCEQGFVCGDAGTCIPGGECGETDFTLEVAPNLLILLDRSGSMDEEIGGVSKWQIAVDSITATIGAYGAAIRFGLALFSNCAIDGSCDAGTVEIACAPDTTPAIIATLAAAPRCSSTPIATSLNAMIGEPSIQDAARQNAILLITDGQDSCGGDPSPEAAALLAQAISVQTFVVGFGGAVDGPELAETATAGGTALAADPVYYQADNAGDLDAALSDISSRVLGCTYPLPAPPPGEPPDASLISVFFNGDEQVAQGPDGWTYDAATNSLVFAGAACARLEGGEVADIDVFYACPDDVG